MIKQYSIRSKHIRIKNNKNNENIVVLIAVVMIAVVKIIFVVNYLTVSPGFGARRARGRAEGIAPRTRHSKALRGEEWKESILFPTE